MSRKPKPASTEQHPDWMRTAMEIDEWTQDHEENMSMPTLRQKAFEAIAQRRKKSLSMIRRAHSTYGTLMSATYADHDLQVSLLSSEIPFATAEYLARICRLDLKTGQAQIRKMIENKLTVLEVKSFYDSLAAQPRPKSEGGTARAFENACKNLLPILENGIDGSNGKKALSPVSGKPPEIFRYFEMFASEQTSDVYCACLYTPKSQTGLRSLRDGFAHWHFLAGYCHHLWILMPTGHKHEAENLSELLQQHGSPNIGVALVSEKRSFKIVRNPTASKKVKKLPLS